jgi:hypothetical protein
MTRDEMLELKPGRELDELVIRHIMNIPIVESVDLFGQEPFPAAWWVEDEGWYIADERDEDGLIYMPFNPSEDISAAWEVAEKMSEEWPQFSIARVDTGWCVMWGFDGYGWPEATGKTAPEAICKAALMAVMDGEDEHERD